MDKDEIWKAALTLLLSGVSEDDPKRVFLNLITPIGIFGDQFVFTAQSAQVESWVKKNYLKEMEEKLEMLAGTHLNVGIGTTGMPAPEARPEQQPAAPAAQASAQQAAATPTFPVVQAPQPEPKQPDWMNEFVNPADLPGAVSDTAPGAEEAVMRGRSSISGDEALFSKCTFDTFVVGKSNEFARGAALAVAEQPGIAYNPLFIYGNSGLGKTHLLVAIANYAIKNRPELTTRYVSANQFLDDFVEAARQARWTKFNDKYHRVDILLVDDVQYLAGKDESINQLFNIFNEMVNQNKQIVLSADRAPKDIEMDDRMRSRFMSGLLADVKPPDYETRLAILKNHLSRAQHTNFHGDIPDDVLSYLAEASTSNIREMEGAVNRLVSNMTLLRKSTITIDEAKDLLQDFFPDTGNRQISIATIQNEVELFFGISHEDMISSKRSKGITTPRHIAIYLARFLTEESLESIGKKFGGRDHTTIMHSVNKIENDQKDNRLLFDQIEQLTIRIRERS